LTLFMNDNIRFDSKPARWQSAQLFQREGWQAVNTASFRCRWRDALRRQHGISGVGKHCDDSDAQPGASAAATSTANTTMHNPTAFHTAGVTATCATLAQVDRNIPIRYNLRQ
jgi:hypothetical protein